MPCRRVVVTLAALVAATLMACDGGDGAEQHIAGPSPVTASPTPAATLTSTPEATPTPEDTLETTSTPQATATPTPTAEVTATPSTEPTPTATTAPSATASAIATRTATASATPGGPSAVNVEIRGFAFPFELTVAAGTRVVWTNRDATVHDVVARDGSWGSGLLGEGGSFEHVFEAPGRFTYLCTIHPFMQAAVIVE